MVKTVLQGYKTQTTQILSPAAAPPGLRCLELCHYWPSTVALLRPLAWSLTSLELLQSQALFEPLLLIDAATGQSLLPHMQHLRIGSRIRFRLTEAQVESRRGPVVQLVQYYQTQLRHLSLHMKAGSSCWPLVEAVFGCSQLRRCRIVLSCTLGLNLRIRFVEERRFNGRSGREAYMEALQHSAATLGGGISEVSDSARVIVSPVGVRDVEVSHWPVWWG